MLPHLLKIGILKTNLQLANYIAVELDEQTVGKQNCPDYLSTFVLVETWMPDFCEVTGRIKRSTTTGEGLKVLCLYTFKGKPALIKRLIKVFVVKK